MTKIRILGYIILVSAIGILYSSLKSTKIKLRDARQNESALLSDLDSVMLDGQKIGVKAESLQLTISQLKKYRAEDAERMKELNIKIKDLESTAKIQAEVNIDLKAQLRDTTVTIVIDSVNNITKEAKYKVTSINTPFLKMNGMVTDTEFLGSIKLPVNIYQYVTASYRRKFLWWRWGLKGFNQTVISDNPHVEIKYAEFIHVGKSKRK